MSSPPSDKAKSSPPKSDAAVPQHKSPTNERPPLRSNKPPVGACLSPGSARKMLLNYQPGAPIPMHDIGHTPVPVPSARTDLSTNQARYAAPGHSVATVPNAVYVTSNKTIEPVRVPNAALIGPGVQQLMITRNPASPAVNGKNPREHRAFIPGPDHVKRRGSAPGSRASSTASSAVTSPQLARAALSGGRAGNVSDVGGSPPKHPDSATTAVQAARVLNSLALLPSPPGSPASTGGKSVGAGDSAGDPTAPVAVPPTTASAAAPSSESAAVSAPVATPAVAADSATAATAPATDDVAEPITVEDASGKVSHPNTVFVANFDPTSQTDVVARLAAHGRIAFTSFIDNQPFGFVQYISASAARAAVDPANAIQFTGGRCVLVESCQRISPGKDPRALDSGESRNTVLVLKNLPFSLKQDALMEFLSTIGRPYAINYHFDSNGLFRGMAFAKYRTLEEAERVHQALIGKEINGRKVRVEYKRKNKGNGQAAIKDPDLLDAQSRKWYEQLRHFRDHQQRDEIQFPAHLSGYERKQVHRIAEQLGLGHSSEGDGDMRYIVVSKTPNTEPLPVTASTAPSLVPTPVPSAPGSPGPAARPPVRRASAPAPTPASAAAGARDSPVVSLREKMLQNAESARSDRRGSGSGGASPQPDGATPTTGTTRTRRRGSRGSGGRGNRDGSATGSGNNSSANNSSANSPRVGGPDARVPVPTPSAAIAAADDAYRSRQQQQLQQQGAQMGTAVPEFKPSRQPKGPDGSRGFAISRSIKATSPLPAPAEAAAPTPTTTAASVGASVGGKGKAKAIGPGRNNVGSVARPPRAGTPPVPAAMRNANSSGGSGSSVNSSSGGGNATGSALRQPMYFAGAPSIGNNRPGLLPSPELARAVPGAVAPVMFHPITSPVVSPNLPRATRPLPRPPQPGAAAAPGVIHTPPMARAPIVRMQVPPQPRLDPTTPAFKPSGSGGSSS